MIRALRSLAFYVAFYCGSVAYVVSAVLMFGLSERVFRKVVNAWGRFHRTCLRQIVGITIEIEGNTPIPPAPGILYAIRHESFFEAIDSSCLFDNPVVFAKQELMEIPLWGVAASRYGIVSVDRAAGAKALRAMLTEARRLGATGRPLVIFPEGTRIAHGTAPPLQAGFAGLYKLLGMPVVPVAVDSGPLYHRRWKRAGTIHYRFGETIPPGLPRDEIEARVHAAINALNDTSEAA